MHIPPYHKKRNYQIFLAGVFIGSVIAYFVVIYMYGKMYEELLSDNIQLQTKVNELNRQNETLLEDKEDLQEQTIPIILSIQINFINSEDLHVDRLITHQLEDLLQSELDSLIGKEIDSVAENDELLITLIENKTLTVDNLSYQFDVQNITFSKELKLNLQITVSD